MSDYRPKARRDELLSESIEDELLVYDETVHQGHSLNRVAAAIWRRCDGETSVPELSRLVTAELGTVASEELVWHALGQLGDRHLLEEPPDAHLRVISLSRRDLVERLALAAGLTLALVTSMPIPAAAQAGSPGPTGPTGATGPTGPTGPIGDTGPTGL
jgi:Coenzyme PQQ synthesis protein D (PqqD)